MQRPIPIEQWRVDGAGPDETRVLAGLVGGEPHVSAPLLAFSPTEAWAHTSDGTDYVLGVPEPDMEPPGTFPRRGLLRFRRAMATLARIRSGQSPTPGELANAPRLDSWATADEHPPVLVGYVTDHPRLPDDRLIRTSPVLWIAEDLSCARTVSRFYRLGPPFGPLRPTD